MWGHLVGAFPFRRTLSELAITYLQKYKLSFVGAIFLVTFVRRL
ncbi:hypothetical protein HMPREF1991_03157 [Hoylesella loescheii DSM 19665 = JCM 12249 = ATCC 15930]|uniref:Uncharacterized protein n=1 Tax=Hoylesella loescheii DSM 19665 = JCM 12249 = ATCC 15930 TaxID=1122985 RepID=A0A069QDB8_HOYLO|nr:hypothetical protein HMPREF1991_03157 [Hoylesella loescheii DSM 19665 = JCM 12249 = ATCC 15930]